MDVDLRDPGLLRRVLLSLSAYEFQRSYWFGGFLVLVAVIIPASNLGEQAEWLSDALAQRWVILVAVGALVAPAVFTLLSEVTFWWLREHGDVDDTAVKRMMPSAPVRHSSDPPAQASYLLPVGFSSGGLKQVFGAFFTRQFKSHLFGFSPYSVWMSPESGHKTQQSRRVIFLARAGDPIDIEKIGRSYRAIRVCDGCWMLDRIPMEEPPDA